MASKKPKVTKKPVEVRIECNCKMETMFNHGQTNYDENKSVFVCPIHKTTKVLITNHKKEPGDRMYREGM